ncbi:hypothetical protein [Nocardioides sp. 1609]|uniref:hypothetical protein n=1 Tax=Nocardioides sp. 1609 TaxID=2508327 RepID=UPI001430DDB9|nr:hypothetical protein [Nocardioides sp. 1609]
MSTGPSDPDPTTADVDTDAPADPDTQSDPALDDSTTSEWAGEGGAVDEGPATAVDDDA